MSVQTFRKSQYLFLETCATIITLVLLGNLIEEKSEKKVSNLIKKRLSNNQNFKIKKIINEKIENINIQDLKTNDIFLLNEVWKKKTKRLRES